MSQRVRAEDLAFDKWPDILVAAGVDRAYFGDRAGPCPFCGGTDRYVWQNKNGGRYLCRHCTEARYRSGIDFLMRHLSVEFIEAADYVRDHFGVGRGCDVAPVTLPRREVARREVARREIVDVDAARARMQWLWNESHAVRQGDPVDLYLRRRVPGLSEVPEQIRLHPRLGYYGRPAAEGDRPSLVGYFPAMLVRGFDVEGNLVQIHKTYLTAAGHKAEVEFPKKTDRGVGSNSFALRMQDPVGDTLGVCEGIETALAATMLSGGLPVWPCHSAGILANFVLPVHLRGRVQRLVIYADSDDLKHGRRAGIEAANRLAERCRKDRLRCRIMRPAKTGTDMADLVDQA
jgi:putative DNA primase/helicase